MKSSKLKGLQKNIFKLLIFLLPTQLSYFFWPESAYVFGIRIDYLAPSIYLTDLVFLVLFVLFLFTQGREILEELKKGRLITYVLLSAVFIVLNLLSSASIYPALFKWLKIFELFLFGYVLVKIKDLEIVDWIIKPLMLSVTSFSLIGILQFLKAGTLGGVFYYLGERTFTKSTPGIATLSFRGQEFLRPYSTFGHPNAFSGFVGASLLLVYSVLQKRFMKLKYLTIFLGGVALFLAFSLGSFVALIASIFVAFVFKNNQNKLPVVLAIIIFLSLILLSISSKLDLETIKLGESTFLRLVLANSSQRLISEFPLFGVGLNNFIVDLPRVYSYQALRWLQPVHNIFLLNLVEVGVVGFIAFILLVLKVFKNYLSVKGNSLFMPFLFILLTGLFDHYWLTLQQNLFLLTLVIALSFRLTSKTIYKS